LAFAPIAHAQEDGFVPLFNGKDLTGWHNVNCAPKTFSVKDGLIVTTGIPTGYLRTAKQYENFILEFEWFHAPTKKGDVGNSGLFVWGDPIPAVGTGYTRSIEVQVLVNLEVKDLYTSQGDLFSIHGAKCKPDRPHPKGLERCLPSENRCKGEYEWNHYRVEAKDGSIKLAVNGKIVSGVSECKPRKGYLALESEGSECRFKNLKIKELPTSNPPADEVADVDKGWKCLFTGIDLAGWKATDEHKAHWKMKEGVLSCDGKCKADIPHLFTEKTFQYGQFELVCDWLGGDGAILIPVRSGSYREVPMTGDKKGWNRYVLRVNGGRVALTRNGKKVVLDDNQATVVSATGSIGLRHDGGQFRNVFVRELKGDE